MAWNSLPDFIHGIQRAAQTVLVGVYLKRTCSRVTSASSALGVLDDYADTRYTNPLTRTVTHVQSGCVVGKVKPTVSNPQITLNVLTVCIDLALIQLVRLIHPATDTCARCYICMSSRQQDNSLETLLLDPNGTKMAYYVLMCR